MSYGGDVKFELLASALHLPAALYYKSRHVRGTNLLALPSRACSASPFSLSFQVFPPSVAGVSATGIAGSFLVWGEVDTDQTPSWGAITTSQTPSWQNVSGF